MKPKIFIFGHYYYYYFLISETLSFYVLIDSGYISHWHHLNYHSAPAGTKRRGGSGGLNKVCGVSPELQAVVGEPALPRTEVLNLSKIDFSQYLSYFASYA